MQTIGLSPKAVLAFFFPFISTCVGVLVTWIVDGTFDGTALKVAIAGVLTSALALLGAYVGRPGVVETPTGEFDDENVPETPEDPKAKIVQTHSGLDG